MAAAVQVLCPNGRRQTVKVTPNTKLLQVLEEVCTKQSFLPADDYDLIHGRKTLDLTLAFRFSNLSNNAKLELVKSSAPRSQAKGEVTIALQLENGERLQHTFPPSVSLWDILQHWETQGEKHKGQLMRVDTNQSPSVQPVCIYMTDEVIGETALQYTTLKKLALTSGKAIIRLVHRPVEDATLAEIIGKIEQEKAKQAKLAQKAAENVSLEPKSSTPSASSQDLARSSSTDAQHPTSTEVKMEVDKLSVESGQEPVQVNQVTVSPDTEPMETEESKPEKDTGVLKSEAETQDVKPQTGIHDTKSGTQDAKSSIKTQDSETQKAVSKAEGASSAASQGSSQDRASAGASGVEQLRQMNIPGVDIITPGDFHDLSPDQQQMARRLMEQLVPGLMGRLEKANTKPKPSRPAPPPQSPFAEFKFPEETKGKNLYRNDLSEVNVEEYKACDRETVVYDSNEENTSKAIAEDPPEDFFEVTDADVKRLYQDLQRQVSSEKPLMTESMRQMELEEKHRHYHHVVIRVQFPDALVLQGCFRPRETVFALHKFVKEHLEDKGQKFHLYRTPPKQIFTDMAKTLVQADLAPASLVYFSSEKTEEHSLASSARMEVSSKRRADELSVKKLAKDQMERLASDSGREEAPKASSSAGLSGGNSARSTDAGPRSAQKTSATASSDAKVPKWLKIGKK